MRLRGTFALGPIVLAIGCASTANNPPPPSAGSNDQAPITAEPNYALPAGHAWAPFFRGKKVIVSPQGDEKVKDAELRAFTSGFQDAFFGSSSPFVKVDSDAMGKAAERRAVLGNAPSGAVLSQLAASEGADFSVNISLTMNTAPRPPSERFSSEIVATGEARLAGSGKDPGSSSVSHNQQTASKTVQEYRLAHARVVGKLAGQKLLLDLSQANAAASSSIIYIKFKFFNANDKRMLTGDLIPQIEGVDADTIKESSAIEGGSDGFVLEVMCSKSVAQFQRDLTAVLAAEEINFLDSRSSSPEIGGEFITIEKRR